jgi:hypothetical protein
LRDLPPGFDADYQCKRHPERPAVAPIACRRCQECHEAALANYADCRQDKHAGVEYPTWSDRGPMDLSIKGEFLGWYKPTKDLF